MRLIDAGKLNESFETLKIGSSLTDCMFLSGAQAVVSGQKTIDAEPVVRCKECKHCGRDKEFDRWWCNRMLGSYETEPYGFCSYGEKMDQEVQE